MFLQQVDREINDMMARALDEEATEEEIQFLKNLYQDLSTVISKLEK